MRPWRPSTVPIADRQLSSEVTSSLWNAPPISLARASP